MSKENKELYEFGSFRLDVDERTFELIDGSKNGSLREKAFHKLAVLVRNRGRSTYQDLSLNRIGERMIAPRSKMTFKYMSGRAAR